MFKKFVAFYMLIFFGLLSGNAQETKDEDEKDKKEVLLFYKTEGFWHNSIPTGRTFIEDLGEDHDFEVTSTKDADNFHSEDLKKYDLVIFLNTTGNVGVMTVVSNGTVWNIRLCFLKRQLYRWLIQ